MKNLFEGTVVDSPYSLSSFSARRPQPPSPTPPPQESSEDLATRLSKISGSSITITPYSIKSAKSSAPVQVDWSIKNQHFLENCKFLGLNELIHRIVL